MTTVVKQVETETERQACLNIRQLVFVDEQKIPFELEFDDFDKSGLFVLALKDSRPVGTCRIRKVEGYIKVERVAILKSVRGQGFGRLLMDYAVQLIERNYTNLIPKVHAQSSIADFYQALGWCKTVKPPFIEDGIEHCEMIKVLNNQKAN